MHKQLFIFFLSFISLQLASIENNGLYAHHPILDDFGNNSSTLVQNEQLTYEEGFEELKFIFNQYPELIDICNNLHPNNSLDDVQYDYPDCGTFSPAILRSMKIAWYLRNEFGNELKNMYIAEIGQGYECLPQILSEFCGYTGYTIIDKKISHNSSHNLKKYDLIISNFFSSELNQNEQTNLLEKIIQSTPNGFFTFDAKLSARQDSTYLLKTLIEKHRHGRIEPEKNRMEMTTNILVWRAKSKPKVSVLKEKVPSPPPLTDYQTQNAVVCHYSGGRLGDNLVAYFHGRWIARKYGLPFICNSFPYSDIFMLSEMDPSLDFNGLIRFLYQLYPTTIPEIFTAKPSTLLVIPYFPEFLPDRRMPDHQYKIQFDVDWEDPLFRQEVLACLKPKIPIETLSLPKGFISVAVHVRRGGSYDVFAEKQAVDPLRFPQNEYYISEIERISKIFENQLLYVYIFTDDQNPNQIVEHFSKTINNPRIIFECENHPHEYDIRYILKDFFSMAKFDCLIRPGSNFSIMAEIIGNHKITIAPMHSFSTEGKVVIDQIEIKFK